MSNFTITNKQGSILSLSPLQDENGIALVLLPKGQPGDAKVISAETADHEIIDRVKKANWVSLAPIGVVAAAAPPPTPAPSKPAAPPPLPPPPPAPVAVTPEPTVEMPQAAVDALVEETKTPEPFETTTPVPAKPSKSRNK